MIPNRISALACVLILFFGLVVVAASSEYFPKVLQCGLSWDHLAPPSGVLARAKSEQAPTLFFESLEGLAKTTIVPKWLPVRYDNAEYLTFGEGAYRAETAHLYKGYKNLGCRVMLKRFAGRQVLVVDPIPESIKITPEAQEAFVEAQKTVDPCGGYSPYWKQKNAPAWIGLMFASICDEFLTSAAYPINKKEWDERLNAIYMVDGWIKFDFLSKGPIHDPGSQNGAADVTDVAISTNGKQLVISIGDGIDRGFGNKLYNEINPGRNIPTKDLNLPYVTGIMTSNEWTDNKGNLVVDQKLATHRILYIGVGSERDWTAIVPKSGNVPVEEGAWLCLAKLCVGTVVSNGPSYIQWSDNKPSRYDFYQNLKKMRGRSLAAMTRLAKAPCPKTLVGTRDELLSKLKVEKPIWDAALSAWESALNNTREDTVDYQVLKDGISRAIESKGLPDSFDRDECNKSINTAESRLGIKTDESCGD